MVTTNRLNVQTMVHRANQTRWVYVQMFKNILIHLLYQALNLQKSYFIINVIKTYTVGFKAA